MALASEAPKYAFGTKEWAEKNTNIINGCVHNCIYCYAREMAARFKRVEPGKWHLEKLKKTRVKRYRKIEGYYMYPTTHDISVKNLGESIIEIRKILESGSKILIVSKPHLHCIKRICKEFEGYRDKILLRFTMGSANDDVLRFWEPYAPKFSERLASLKWAHAQGFKTSVSCEPMLDDKIQDVVRLVSPYVTGTIWLGKANRLNGRLKVNGYKSKKYMDAADQLIAWQSDDNIMELYEQFKDDPKIEWKESIRKVIDRRMKPSGRRKKSG